MFNWLKRKVIGTPAPQIQPGPDPDRVSGLINEGIQAERRGDAESAERLFRQAVEAGPEFALAHLNLGLVLQGRGDLDGAIGSYTRAISLEPAMAIAHFDLALARLAAADPRGAERDFRAALERNPDLVESWVGLAEALEAQGKDEDALGALRRAIALRPAFVGALFNAAMLLRKLGRLDDAEPLLRSIEQDDPEFGNAMMALAAILRDRGETAAAVDALEAAVDKFPDSVPIESELLFTLGFSDRVDAAELCARHFRAGQRLEAATPRWKAAFANRRDPERVLRIGYMSADFRMHSVAAFTEFLFARHRREKVNVFAYSSTPSPDAMTDRIIAAADGWRDLRDQPDAAVARAILEDEIDILVDLSGHTTGARPKVLAGRAAPVQMTWLGYMNTTGLTQVDYRITDPIADPPGKSEHLYTERLLRMPCSQWCFRPPEAARNENPGRDRDLGAFTFGSMNQYAKISEASLALWIEVLNAVPDSRLRVVNVPRGRAMYTLEESLCDAGIDRARFDLVERVPQASYYAQFAKIDACLDSTPYSGGTTTCDALYLGVPVITLAGERPVSRSTASLLGAVGASEWTASSTAEFVEIAGALASRKIWSYAERATLRSRMLASPLMDEQRFTRDLEALYLHAWERWCRGG